MNVSPPRRIRIHLRTRPLIVFYLPYFETKIAGTAITAATASSRVATAKQNLVEAAVGKTTCTKALSNPIRGMAVSTTQAATSGVATAKEGGAAGGEDVDEIMVSVVGTVLGTGSRERAAGVAPDGACRMCRPGS